MSRVLPILFNTDMVRAILEGRKTVTRRVVKPRYQGRECGFQIVISEAMGKRRIDTVDDEGFTCRTGINPPYNPGDILYVRETWNICNMDIENNSIVFIYRAAEPEKDVEQSARTATVPDEIFNKYYESMAEDNPEWRPSLHMPKEAARIWLKVTDVRVERLQDITSEEAVREGTKETFPPLALDEFREIWNSTIKKSELDWYGWDANPWVWAIKFERCEKPEE